VIVAPPAASVGKKDMIIVLDPGHGEIGRASCRERV
jgi:N-acetylmuramoyl-L-alanine amidase